MVRTMIGAVVELVAMSLVASAMYGLAMMVVWPALDWSWVRVAGLVGLWLVAVFSYRIRENA